MSLVKKFKNWFKNLIEDPFTKAVEEKEVLNEIDLVPQTPVKKKRKRYHSKKKQVVG